MKKYYGHNEIVFKGDEQFYYTSTGHCSNCGAFNHLQILKGIRVEDIDPICAFCKCHIRKPI